MKGSWGIYNQFVNRVINTDINNGLPDFWLLAEEDEENGDVPSKRSQHFILGLSWQKNNWIFDVEGYYKDTDDILDYLPLGRNFPSDFSSGQEFFTGDNESRGIDFLIKRSTDRYTGWVSYSLSESRDQLDGLNENVSFPSNEDQTHEFKTVHLWKLGRWNLSGTWIFATGRPFTAPSGQFTGQSIGSEPVTTFQINQINGQRLPDYHRLDLSAGYTFELGKFQLESGLSIYNLYNQRNIKFTRFDIAPFSIEDGQLSDGTQLESFDVELLGITPNLFVNISF